MRFFLNNPISVEENEKAITTLVSNKAAGLDGFMVELYKKYKTLTASKLCKDFLACMCNNVRSSSWTRKKFMLITKGGKDLTNPQSYRPISSFNTDNTLMTILAKGHNVVLTEYINKNQMGFLQGRYLKDNIWNVINIIGYSQIKEIPILLYFLDAKKAFDRVEWPFMKYVFFLGGGGKPSRRNLA